MSRYLMIFLILAIFGLPLWLKPASGVYPLIANLSLLPLGALTYLEGFALGVIGAIGCIALCLLYAAYMNIGLSSVAPVLLAFVATPIALGMLKRASRRREITLTKTVSETEYSLQQIKGKDEKLNEQLAALDGKVSEIANLYEVTKAMSSTLSLGEIFQVFNEFLRKTFKFSSCKLILTSHAPGGGAVEKVYKIEGASPAVVPPELADMDIATKVIDSKEIARGEDFIAVPLVSQDRVIGILNVEALGEGELERFLIVARQFSLEIKKALLYETVQELSITDGLTDLFVRRYFMEMLKEEFERSARHKFKLSFLMIDLDHFKECNDKYGHLVGDVVLREVAKVLKQNLREIDPMGRYGGEEFSVLLPETDNKGALLVGERLRRAVDAKIFKAYDEVLKITISAGVSTFPDGVATVEDLIEKADQALYEAKQQGRNRVVSFRGEG